MCNPRRVRVQATRKIAEAWRAEIQQAATARGDVNSEARLVQNIADLLPPRAKVAFEQAMRVSPHWVWQDGQYRRTVPGGYTGYRPDTGELEIVITLSVAIEAIGTASLVATGEIIDEVTAEATGTYYTDVAGSSRELATQQAKAAADAQADELAQRRAAALKHEATEKARHDLNTRAGEAAQEAKRTAERQLTLQAEQLRPELDARANRELEAVQAETLKAVFQLVATGYSAALQAYATEYGENLTITERDGVISVQFELEG
jgi:hypothetical protein